MKSKSPCFKIQQKPFSNKSLTFPRAPIHLPLPLPLFYPSSNIPPLEKKSSFLSALSQQLWLVPPSPFFYSSSLTSHLSSMIPKEARLFLRDGIFVGSFFLSEVSPGSQVHILKLRFCWYLLLEFCWFAAICQI